jgi:hypothetical protein
MILHPLHTPNNVIIVTQSWVGYGLYDTRFLSRQVKTFFSSPEKSRTGYGAQWSSYSVATVVLSWRQSGRDVMLTTHLHLVPRSRIGGAIPLLLYMSSWCRQGQFYIFYPLPQDTYDVLLKEWWKCNSAYGMYVSHCSVSLLSELIILKLSVLS